MVSILWNLKYKVTLSLGLWQKLTLPALSLRWSEKWKSLSHIWLCDSIDCTVHGILQARILEWVAFPFFRGSSQPRDQTQVSHIAGGFFTSWATWDEGGAHKATPLAYFRFGRGHCRTQYLVTVFSPLKSGGCSQCSSLCAHLAPAPPDGVNIPVGEQLVHWRDNGCLCADSFTACPEGQPWNSLLITGCHNSAFKRCSFSLLVKYTCHIGSKKHHLL